MKKNKNKKSIKIKQKNTTNKKQKLHKMDFK